MAKLCHSEIPGAQAVRIADVALVGPLMITAAIRATGWHWFWRYLLGAAGMGTIAWNGIELGRRVKR